MPTAEAATEWEAETPESVQTWAPPEAEGRVQQREPRAAGGRTPYVHPALEAEIARAEEILKLEADWDGEGSPTYSKETFERAVSFLTDHSRYLWSCGIYPPVPHIGPGPEGSIDLHWRQQSWELLVNIPADPAAMASFYGDNYGAQKIKGSIDPRTVNLGIVAWLMT